MRFIENAQIVILAVFLTVVTISLPVGAYDLSDTLVDTQTIGDFYTPEGNHYYVVTETWDRGCEDYYTEIWAKDRPYASSYGDMYLFTVDGIENPTSDSYKIKSALCDLKRKYDAGMFVLDCATSAACGACVYTGCGGGIACLACVAACDITLNGGAASCATGIISRVTGNEDIQYASPGGLSDLGVYIIDQYCEE